jgi:hypothetical protein
MRSHTRFCTTCTRCYRYPLCFFCVRMRACVWLLPECACLLATCVRRECARARLHSAGVCTAGRPDAVPPGRAQVLQLARRGGADRISLSERNYRMQRRACPISAMQRRAGRHKRDASGAHLRRRSLSKPIAARRPKAHCAAADDGDGACGRADPSQGGCHDQTAALAR